MPHCHGKGEMTNPMDATLKAIFGKFRANFTSPKEKDVLESPPNKPLALPGSNASESVTPLESGAVERGRRVPPLSEKVSPELQAVLDERVRAAKERMEHKEASGNPLALPESNVVRLPIVWAESVRGVPNGMLRSALFGAIKKGPRRYMHREEIAAQDGIQIFYTGQRLDQGDLDVWETVLHLVRAQAIGSDFRVTAYQLLKALSKKDTGSNRDTLESRLSRMKATGVDVHIGRYGYEGSLIDEVYRDKKTREYVIRLNPKLSSLFAADQFTQIDWNVRHALDGQPLAQWLHGYYASHAQPFPLKVETIHKLCGSESTLMSDFAKNLHKALDVLTDACCANEQPFSYEIRGDIVHVERKASATQRRHLAKKTTKRLPRGKA
jgi:TrfA protein